MIKVGLFIDGENIMRCGGYGLRYEVLKQYAERFGTVLRANMYIAQDIDREEKDYKHREGKETFRESLRKMGYRVITKPVKKYTNGDTITYKANVDVELAIDALVQSQNLDHVILVSGDGDFCSLITALQNKGLRVDVIGFKNVSRELRQTADYYTAGNRIEGLIKNESEASAKASEKEHTGTPVHPSHLDLSATLPST